MTQEICFSLYVKEQWDRSISTVTEYGLDDHGVQHLPGTKIFLFFITSRPVLQPIQFPMHCIQGVMKTELTSHTYNLHGIRKYILSLMLFIIENQQDFFTSEYIHGLDTRNKNHLYLPALSLTCVQKGVLYSGINIFNKLPSKIQNYKGDRKIFKKELKKYLTVHSFYSITEFLECKTNKRDV